MDKVYKGLVDMDDIQFRMKCAIDLVGAVQEVMISGSCDAENYTDALYGAKDYLWGLNADLRLCIDDLLEASKKGATA